MRLHVQGKEGINLWWGWGGRAVGSVVRRVKKLDCVSRAARGCPVYHPLLPPSPPPLAKKLTFPSVFFFIMKSVFIRTCASKNEEKRIV
jgi:hypothetical protein